MRSSRYFLSSPAAERIDLFTPAEWTLMRQHYATHSPAQVTPLHRLPLLASALGIDSLVAKDETDRFGLPAFKGLGAGFAMAELRRGDRLREGDTVACASEGNHGRAVARAARQLGLRARVYVAEGVAPARVRAIAAGGADIVTVRGRYDDAVRQAADDAAQRGWQVISDTAYPGYEEIPRLITLGYARLMDESAAQWGDAAPDLIVVPAGVGALAAAVASWAARSGNHATRLLCVEPLNAACCLASAEAGRLVTVSGSLETILGGLRCGEVSHIAWPALQRGYDAFLAIDDAWVREAMRALARPMGGDPALPVGACGAAGLAALFAIRTEPALAPLRAALDLGERTRAMIILTEGVTEPALLEAVLAD